MDLYIQKDFSGADKQSNWLPAPAGEFILMLRLYWPKDEAVDRAWAPPPVRGMDWGMAGLLRPLRRLRKDA